MRIIRKLKNIIWMKNWRSMGIFMVILCCYHICDTFTESTAPNKLSESVLEPFGHHEDDQEAQEQPPNDCLFDFGYIDGDFVFLPTRPSERSVGQQMDIFSFLSFSLGPPTFSAATN